MPEISVPLSAEQHEQLDSLIQQGVGTDYIDLIHHAIDKLAEDEAVKTVETSIQEINEGKVLRGDLRDLLAE